MLPGPLSSWGKKKRASSIKSFVGWSILIKLISWLDRFLKYSCQSFLKISAKISGTEQKQSWSRSVCVYEIIKCIIKRWLTTPTYYVHYETPTAIEIWNEINLSFTFSPNILKGLLVPTRRLLCSLPTLTSAKLPSWPLGGWGPWLPWFFSAAAAAKSLQSWPTLWDPIDGSPPGSPVPGIL